MRHNSWRIGAGLILGGVALWLAARGTDLDALRRAVADAHTHWILVALLSVVITVAAGVARWRLLFYPDAHARSWWTLTAALLVGQMLNIVLPLRLGEVARAGWVGRAEAIPLGRALGTIAMERLADLVTVGSVVFALIALAAVPGWLVAPGRALVGIALVAGGLLLVIAMRGQSMAAFATRVARRLPRAIGSRLERLATTAIEGTRVLDSWTMGAAVAGLSLLVLLLAASTNYLLFLAFDLVVPASAALVLVIALQVGNTLVSVPGNIGVFQYVTVLTLGAYNVDRESAFAYAVLLHVIALAPKIVAGALLLAAKPRSSRS